MSAKTSRRLEYHDRFAVQQADQAIRKDAVRALVELITNSDDSYHRLESAGKRSSGKIIIEINRKLRNSTLRIIDHAEGMSAATMNDQVGTYGAPTSGFLEGESVRGLWGRGLKDSFYGLGHGQIISIKNDKLYIARLYIEDGAPMYEPPTEGIAVTEKHRKKYQIPQGNGTMMDIVISRDDVPIPRIDSLRFKLQQHFELRTIMNNPRRDILLRELGRGNQVKQEIDLQYVVPTGIKIMDDSFKVPDSEAWVNLKVYRSDEPLTSVAEVGDFADGGLLVISKRVVMAITMLKFAHSEFAARIYGSIECDYLHDLLQQEETEPILTATRDGLNWDQPFMKALKEQVELRIDPLILAERRLAEETATVMVDSQLRKRFNSALRRLNSIANSILVASGPKTPARPDIPFNGFGFIKEFANLQANRAGKLTLRAELNGTFAEGDLVQIVSDHPNIKVLTPYVEIEPRKDYPDIGEARVEFEGLQVGVEGILTAEAHHIRAEALVKVVSKPQEEKESSSRGFITDLEFSASADPRQRAVFDRETARIIIATRAPSVMAYLGADGQGAATPQGQVLLAEMVTDVICREIARVGVQNGKLPAFHDNLDASIQAHYNRLVHEYAHEIHNYFVDAKYRRAALNDSG
jgi:hypothetical protein